MKTNSRLKAYALIIIVLTLLFNLTAVTNSHAGLNSIVGEYFSNMVASSNSGQAGYYQSQGENIYSLGYNEVHWNTPVTNIQLFSVAPPSISMGCSGIDEQWGAFTMLGSNLENVLNSIISSGAVVSFAFNIALGVLCKQCQAIMQQLEQVANKLNGLNFNSCSTAEAAAGYLGHAVSKITNFNLSGGQNNSWLNGLSTDLTGNAQGTGKGGILGQITNFENNINCTISQGEQYYLEATQGASSQVSCGAAKVEHMFHYGSMIRKAAVSAHMGLTQGGSLGPGTGGYDDILGVIRGSFTGDIFGYTNSAGKPEPKYIPPATSSDSNGQIQNALLTLINGGMLTSITLTLPNPATNASSLTTLEKTQSIPWPGYYCVYQDYLGIISQNLFGQNVDPLGARCTNNLATSSSGVVATTLDTQQEINFIANSPLPVYKILQVSYELGEPDLVKNAAKEMALASAYQFVSEIIGVLTKNMGGYQDVKGNKYTVKIKKSQLEKMRYEETQLNAMYMTSEKAINLNNKFIDSVRMVEQQIQTETKLSHLSFANYRP
ncbi:MAG: conjugal transfer protein TraH [Deltaproteobacteria bacterium]|jgi:hypothetical protein|nr:conjugal transfer protein TraH [Deltaproteobacteria bacterium]